MGVRILHDERAEIAALFCSTSDWAFGPVFYNKGDKDAYERVQAFLDWLKVDPREVREAILQGRYSEWLAQEDEQYAREKLESEIDNAELRCDR